MTDGTSKHARGVGRAGPSVPPPATGHRPRWLPLARAGWVAMAATALAIVLFSVPSSFEYYRSVCAAASEACSQRAPAQATTEGVRQLREAGLSAGTYAVLNVAIDMVFQLVWFAVGALIFFRRSDDRMALLVSTFLVAFGTVTVDATGADALVAAQQAWWLPVEAVQITGEVCAPLFFLLFPGGRFVPRWTRWLALAFIALNLSRTYLPELYSLSSALQGLSLWVFVGMVASLTWSLVYRYRRALSAEQRRQARWVVFGTALGVAATFPLRLPVDLSLVGGDTPLVLLVLEAGFALSFLLVPLSIGVAVLRSHLFDIDVLINRTLVYGSLTALLAGVYLAGVAATQTIFQSLTGQREMSQLVIVVSTLAIAALFNPLRRRIQAFIDRRFYRGKYDAERTLAAFSARLRSQTDLEALSNDLLGVIGTTVRPEHASLWLRPEAAPEDEPMDQQTLVHPISE